MQSDAFDENAKIGTPPFVRWYCKKICQIAWWYGITTKRSWNAKVNTHDDTFFLHRRPSKQTLFFWNENELEIHKYMMEIEGPPIQLTTFHKLVTLYLQLNPHRIVLCRVVIFQNEYFSMELFCLFAFLHFVKVDVYGGIILLFFCHFNLRSQLTLNSRVELYCSWQAVIFPRNLKSIGRSALSKSHCVE